MTDTTIKHIASVFPMNADALKEDPTFHRRRSIIREFALNTSTSGIPSIAKSTSIHNRIFWTVSFLVFTGIMMYFLVENIIAYFGYPTQTSVSFLVARSQPFPAVTICNYSPIRYDLFIEPFLNFTNSINVTDTNDTSTITLIQSFYTFDFIQLSINNGESPSKYCFPLESMLLYCSYNEETCQATDFISFFSSAYGLCYTFNAQTKSNQSNIRQTTDNGGSGKLELRLYAQSQDYVPYLSDDASAGMMIMVHDNTQLPFIEVAGIQLAPGLKHKIGYKKSASQLLPPPYSDCTDTISPVMQATFDQYEGADYAYSQVLCNTICVQTYLYAECGCVNPLQWNVRAIVLPGTDKIIQAPVCQGFGSCYINATDRITNTDSIWNQYCSGCFQECSTVDFTITTSAVAAPSIQYAEMYKAAVENSGIPLAANWSETWQTEMQNNYIAVDVVCETTVVETYTESASITFVDLISNVGGQTGLWIGISFLSLMEVVELFYRLIRYHWHILRRRIRVFCDCVNPVHWSARCIVLPGTTEVIDAPLCNINDSCYSEAVERFQVDEWIRCKCCLEYQTRCSTTKYLTRVPSLSAPPDCMMTYKKMFVESSCIPLPKSWPTKWQSEIAKNNVASDVVCETARVKNCTEVASISAVGHISNVDGYSGSWI